MNTRERILIGATGALMPTLINLFVVDFRNVLSNLTAITLVFYGLRILFLSLVGGFWTYLHKSEMEPMKVFQLGIVAPALIMGLVNGTSVPKVGAAAIWTRPVYAQTAFPICTNAKVKLFTRPEASTYEQIKQGLTGSPSTRTWYVLVGLWKRLDEAQQQVAYIAKLKKAWASEVYCAPDRRHPETPFAVVIAAQAERGQAEVTLKEAIGAGFLHAFLFDVSQP